MNFEQLLRQAQNGDKKAQEEIFRMYRPLLIKNSMDINIFDEDLYQELSATLLKCMRNFFLAGEGIPAAVFGSLFFNDLPPVK